MSNKLTMELDGEKLTGEIDASNEAVKEVTETSIADDIRSSIAALRKVYSPEQAKINGVFLSNKLRMWNNDFLHSLVLFELLIESYMEDLTVKEVAMTKEDKQSALIFFYSYFYKFSGLGSLGSYTNDYRTFLEVNKITGLNSVFLERLKDSSGTVETVKFLFESLPKDKLDLGPITDPKTNKPKATPFIWWETLLKLGNNDFPEFNNEKVATKLLETLKYKLIHAQFGVTRPMYKEKIVLLNSIREDFKKRMDDLLPMLNEFDIQPSYTGSLIGTLAVRVYLQMMGVVEDYKKFSQFSGIPASQVETLYYMATEDIELELALGRTNVPTSDEADVMVMLKEINETLVNVSTRSYSSSSSSSSSSDDDTDWTVGKVLGLVAGVAVVGYAGAVAYNYFTSASTLGEAIDNVNTGIMNKLGIGDGIKTL